MNKAILILLALIISLESHSQITYNKSGVYLGTVNTSPKVGRLNITDRKGLYWKNSSSGCELTIDMTGVCPMIYGSQNCIEFYNADTDNYESVRCGFLGQIGRKDDAPWDSIHEYLPFTSLEKSLQLRPVTFNWQNSKISAQTDTDIQYGLIAQEVEVIFPELVLTDESGEKFVDYFGLVPILIESIKETKSRLDKQKSEIAKITSSLNIDNQ